MQLNKVNAFYRQTGQAVKDDGGYESFWKGNYVTGLLEKAKKNEEFDLGKLKFCSQWHTQRQTYSIALVVRTAAVY